MKEIYLPNKTHDLMSKKTMDGIKQIERMEKERKVASIVNEVRERIKHILKMAEIEITHDIIGSLGRKL